MLQVRISVFVSHICFLSVVLFYSSVSASSTSFSMEDPAFPKKLANTPSTGTVEISAVPLGNAEPANVILKRFEIFSPDAKITIQNMGETTTLPPPSASYFRGNLAGKPDSKVFLVVEQSGVVKSVIHEGGKVYVDRKEPAESGGLALSREVDKKTDFGSRNFECGVETAHHVKDPFDLLPDAIFSKSLIRQEGVQAKATATTYRADLIIETDHEYYALFGNAMEATQYAANLIGYASSIYQNEINTQLQISNLRLYSSPSDPWNVVSDTLTALTDLKDYYDANYPDTNRTAVHLLSGKNLGGGIAYLSAICINNYNTSYTGPGAYDFGVSADIGGSFNPNNPQIVWDAFVVAHELGHNFGSNHTHAYDLYDAYTQPIDCCDSDGDLDLYGNPVGICADYTPQTYLPGINSLTGGNPDTGAGTIMSYCHLLSPGMTNISMTFGKNHASGIDAWRVPAVMRSLVENVATTYPQCLGIGPYQPQTFLDVPPAYWAYSSIEQLASLGITGGCGNMNYCPERAVDRAEMAVFLLRNKHGANYIPPAATGTVFNDFPTTLWAAKWIEQLSREHITGGCGNGNYCPARAVNRAEMAAFLLRIKHGSGYIPSAATGTMFADVPITHWAAAWIEQLAREGITGGCGNGNYCPNSFVTRAEMAVFLIRTRTS